MDKLLRQLEQDKRRSDVEFEKMKQRVDLIGCVGIGFLILISIACVGVFIGGAIFLCN